jgi:hypothetical protein
VESILSDPVPARQNNCGTTEDPIACDLHLLQRGHKGFVSGKRRILKARESASDPTGSGSRAGQFDLTCSDRTLGFG